MQNIICFSKEGKSCEEIFNELEVGEDGDGQGVGSQSGNGEANGGDSNNNEENRDTIYFSSPGDDAEQSGIARFLMGWRVEKGNLLIS